MFSQPIRIKRVQVFVVSLWVGTMLLLSASASRIQLTTAIAPALQVATGELS